MKNAVITGATSGIGLAVCKEMLRRHYHVIGIGHSRENAEHAVHALRTEFPDEQVVFFYGDLMQQTEVRRIAETVGRHLEEHCEGRLHVLVNNAGCVRSWYATSEDGYEQQFALNHLSGFLLTHFMMPYLARAKGRVLLTASESHKKMKMHWDDIMFQKRYHPLLVYKQSKLCNLLFASAFNEAHSHRGVNAYCIDPGLVKTDIGLKQTGLIVRLVWRLRMRSGVDASVPATTYAWICEQEPEPEALYYCLCKEKRHSGQVNRENAQRLFRYSEQLCGITFGRIDS